jgi:hypothetical protein
VVVHIGEDEKVSLGCKKYVEVVRESSEEDVKIDCYGMENEVIGSPTDTRKTNKGVDHKVNGLVPKEFLSMRVLG